MRCSVPLAVASAFRCFWLPLVTSLALQCFTPASTTRCLSPHGDLLWGGFGSHGPALAHERRRLVFVSAGFVPHSAVRTRSRTPPPHSTRKSQRRWQESDDECDGMACKELRTDSDANGEWTAPGSPPPPTLEMEDADCVMSSPRKAVRVKDGLGIMSWLSPELCSAEPTPMSPGTPTASTSLLTGGIGSPAGAAAAKALAASAASVSSAVTQLMAGHRRGGSDGSCVSASIGPCVPPPPLPLPLHEKLGSIKLV
jgi:hypothetical protein